MELGVTFRSFLQIFRANPARRESNYKTGSAPVDGQT
jgi:hypothetical protein